MSDFAERFISSLLDDLVAQSLNDAYADYMLYLVKSEEMLPAKFNRETTLEETVEDKENVIDFDLQP